MRNARLTSRRPNIAWLLPLVLLLASSSGGEVLAQIQPPAYLMKQGLQAATRLAKDSLGNDARLMYVGTFGEFTAEQVGFSTEFNLDNGKANLWGYVFHSEAKKETRIIGVINLVFSYQAIDLGGFPFPIVISNTALDTESPYSNSDAFVARLKTNEVFLKYRSDLPGAKADLISYGELLPGDSLPIPGGFPLNESTWSISFIGAGDSSMTCFVTAKTGQTFCRRRTGISSVDVPATPTAIASIAIGPNPASGLVRVSIDLPNGMSTTGMTLALFDETGRQLIDLSDRLSAGAGGVFLLDTRTLASGVYYVHARGNGWTGTTGLVIER